MVTNKWIFGTEDFSDAMAVRREVFCKEQGVAECNEEDSYDPLSLHLIIYDGEKPIATGRVYHNGKVWRIGRCCVLKEERKQGIGDLLMKMLLLKVFEYNPSEVTISAQEYAQAFYERYGFERTGDVFLEEGLPHVPMRISKETMRIPTGCGKTKTFYDFFEEKQ